ncbi:MAG: acyl-CoA thioesterase [Parvibaculum sp.]|nr:acyl-CoA thioesterase [Parvibaculum sp.]
MKAIVTASALFDVQFYDLDPMNIVWHGNYAKYFEIGRVVLLSKIGYGYNAMKDSGYAWPVIDMHVRYYRPLELGRQVEVVAGIVEWENRLKIDYLLRDPQSGLKITRGHTVHVALDIETKEMQWETPPVLRGKIARWLS